jgi:NhaA family Na+:H+ antiporter
MAAFTIPADVRINETDYINKMRGYLTRLNLIHPNNKPTLSEDQVQLFDEIKKNTHAAIPPLQQLEHAIHPFATFIVIPVFALSNAGVSLDISLDQFASGVTTGVALGLLAGKVTGVVGTSLLMVKLKLALFPEGMNLKNLTGIGLLASIGFTMSLFITSLAFTNPENMVQAKIGIFTASILGGLAGYIVLRKNAAANKDENGADD